MGSPEGLKAPPMMITVNLILMTILAVTTFADVKTLAPKITKPPEALYETVAGASVYLHCRVFGDPQPQVTWRRSGEELTGGRYMVQPNGDLYIHKAFFTDVGRYKCYAENQLGSVSSDDSLGHLEVRDRTRILAKPEDHEVVAGKSATFRCNAVADVNLKYVIEWQANGQTIDFLSDHRIYQSADSSLTISKTTQLDSGVYTCIAKTKLDNDSAEATLIVQDRPNAPRLVGVECKQNTALVEWQPMGDNLAPILGYDIQYNTSFTPDDWKNAWKDIPATDLKFEVSLSPWANYSFRVIAKNKIDPSPPSLHSTVCQIPPDVPYKNPENVQGSGTTPSNLVISWMMMPLIEHNGPSFFYRVFWKRAFTEMDWHIVDVADWKQTNLVIENRPTYEQYNIRVEAHNQEGQANVLAVDVIGYSGEDIPLEAPNRFSFEALHDGKTAEFSWDPVHLNSVRGQLKGYKIQTWKNEEGPEHIRVTLVPANRTRAIVNTFAANSRNYARVLAYNGRYDGPPSDLFTVLTPEGKPGPVSLLDAVPMGSNALLITWRQPEVPNGYLKGYHIFYQKVHGTELTAKMMRKFIGKHDPTSALLDGLEPNTRYRVTVYAETTPGLGEPYFIDVSTSDWTPDVATTTANVLKTTSIRPMPANSNLKRKGYHVFYERVLRNLKTFCQLVSFFPNKIH